MPRLVHVVRHTHLTDACVDRFTPVLGVPGPLPVPCPYASRSPVRGH
ncbi:hypothetical protein SSCG_01951 [Streptomyces clavuligerus]|nr:hypothetical protein SSCG_01951 [Streptomyces clavuligerus]